MVIKNPQRYGNGKFYWFVANADRLIVVNKNFVSRIVFCLDYSWQEEYVYCDNFQFLDNGCTSICAELENQSSNLDKPKKLGFKSAVVENNLPSLIFKHSAKTLQDDYYGNSSAYWSIGEGKIKGIGLSKDLKITIDETLEFTDENGEENLMPTQNLVLVEINSGLVIRDRTENLFPNSNNN